MSKNTPNSDEQVLSDLYQSTRSDAAEEGPSHAMDAAILAQAEQALKPRRRRPAWLAPVGLAATILIGVNLAVNLKDYSEESDFYKEAVRASSESSKPAEINQRQAAHLDDELTVTRQKRDSERSGSEVQRQSDAIASSNAQPQETVQTPATDARINEYESGRLTTTEPTANRKSAEPERKRVTHSSGLGDVSSGALASTPAPAPAPTTPADAVTLEKPETIHEDVSVPSPTPTVAELSVARSEERSDAAFHSEPDSAPPSISPEALIAPRDNSSVDRPARAAADSSKWREDATEERMADAVIAQTMEMETENAVKTGDEDDLQEVVVTGSRITRDDSPHRRLTARRQVLANEVRTMDPAEIQLTNTINSDSVSEESQTSYQCDLAKLEIDQEAVELAKIEALTAEPPLNAVTWPTLIRRHSQLGNRADACAHLLAYRALFPDVVLPEPLPVELPPVDTQQ